MTKPTKIAVRPKRSKAEVEQEFTEIRADLAEARESSSTRVEEQAKLREIETRQSVEGLSVEGVVQKVSGLGLEVSKSLADLSEKLVQEVNRLAAVREAVALEQKELERLHKIDVAATAVDQLVEDYARQKEQLEAEIAARRAAAEATRGTEQKLEQQLTLAKKDQEAEARVAELRVKTMEETLARQSTQAEGLQKQLDEAKRQVQEIAVKAIEGASGARALSHINEIAMEQAKHRAQQG